MTHQGMRILFDRWGAEAQGLKAKLFGWSQSAAFDNPLASNIN